MSSATLASSSAPKLSAACTAGLCTEKVRLVRGNAVLVDDVSVTFRPGEFVSILGPNGAGKSSVLKLLTREMHPSAGSVTWDGKPLRDWPVQEMAKHRAVLPQES